MRKSEIMKRKFDRNINRWCWIVDKEGIIFKGIISKTSVTEVYLRKLTITPPVNIPPIYYLLLALGRNTLKRKNRGSKGGEAPISFRDVDLYGCE